MYSSHQDLLRDTIKRGRWLFMVLAVAVLSIYLTSNLYALAAGNAIKTNSPSTWLEPIQAYKTASQWFVASGQVFTYTIHVRNFSLTDTTAQVADPLPNDVSYITGSANLGAVYDAGSNTLLWNTLSVTSGSEIALQFAVIASLVTTPTIVTNTATITAGAESLKPSTRVVVIPESMAAANLLPSFKYAARFIVSAGGTVPYVIKLINTGTLAATADVTDPLPSELNYVPGSASTGGVYDAGTRTLSWHLNVPAFGRIGLTYLATATTNIVSPTFVVNTATIASGQQQFDRRAAIVIVPESEVPPNPMLAGSYKKASERWLTPTDTLTYTVKLINSGAVDALVNVTDPVPPALSYMTGSANNDGVYDPVTKIVSWVAITVPAWSSVPLEFAVLPSTVVTHPILVANTATISVTGDGVFNRMAWVVLLPTSSGDRIPPVVHSLTIDDQDVLTSPTTTLHISATDNISVSQMFIREWQLTSLPFPHWTAIQTSGWVPYQTDYPWTLMQNNGVHYVAVWVADAAHNVSELDRNALDFASLVQPGATVAMKQVVPYLVYYPAGVTVTARLTSTAGDADLYVWFPHNFLWPDRRSIMPVAGTDAITFTTTRPGIYLFLVRGYTAATYDLSIDPAGGPRAGSDNWGVDDEGASAINLTAPAADAAKPDALTYEPVLSTSGLDPLMTAPAPSGFYQVYLPNIIR